MTAIIYFGEMLVASLLAIVLLAISRLPTSSDAVLFAGGVVAWTLAEYIVHRFVLHGFAPTEHRSYWLRNFDWIAQYLPCRVRAMKSIPSSSRGRASSLRTFGGTSRSVHTCFSSV
jgi:hypothetical protein